MNLSDGIQLTPLGEQILQTVMLVLVLLILRRIIRGSIKNVGNRLKFNTLRTAVLLKIIGFLFWIALLIGLGVIWQIKRADFFIFLSSILAVIGVAFFAQWSLLSNVTASFILYFNHPLKIGDRIKIYDKDFPFEGKIEDITAFFIYIKLEDDTVVSIPNSLVLQKSITIY